jgi:ATP-dependent Clp protease ATP-binding subunit ClpC
MKVLVIEDESQIRDIMQGRTLGFHGGESPRRFDKMQETIKEELAKVFNPEFLNRLDDVIVFHPLDKDHIGRIVTIMLREVQRRLGIDSADSGALDLLVVKGTTRAMAPAHCAGPFSGSWKIR